MSGADPAGDGDDPLAGVHSKQVAEQRRTPPLRPLNDQAPFRGAEPCKEAASGDIDEIERRGLEARGCA